jgi:hypothetical protein
VIGERLVERGSTRIISDERGSSEEKNIAVVPAKAGIHLAPVLSRAKQNGFPLTWE